MTPNTTVQQRLERRSVEWSRCGGSFCNGTVTFVGTAMNVQAEHTSKPWLYCIGMLDGKCPSRMLVRWMLKAKTRSAAGHLEVVQDLFSNLSAKRESHAQNKNLFDTSPSGLNTNTVEQSDQEVLQPAHPVSDE